MALIEKPPLYIIIGKFFFEGESFKNIPSKFDIVM